MSVYQVEEYYIAIHDISITPVQKTALLAMFKEHNIEDFEIGEDTITIDGFESQSEAENFEEITRGVLEEY